MGSKTEFPRSFPSNLSSDISLDIEVAVTPAPVTPLGANVEARAAASD